MKEIQEVIARFIACDLLHLDSTTGLSADWPLLAEGVLDSLGLQQLVAFLESEYGIAFGDDQLVPETFESIDTLARVVDGLRRRLSAGR